MLKLHAKSKKNLRITNDAREDEMDENVQQVATMVNNLRNMAIGLSTFCFFFCIIWIIFKTCPPKFQIKTAN